MKFGYELYQNSRCLKCEKVKQRKFGWNAESTTTEADNMKTDQALPQTPRVRKLLKLAELISIEMGLNYVGTEHILLALFRIAEGTGNRMLKASGANEEAARREFQLWKNPALGHQEEKDALKAKILELETKLARFSDPQPPKDQ